MFPPHGLDEHAEGHRPRRPARRADQARTAGHPARDGGPGPVGGRRPVAVRRDRGRGRGYGALLGGIAVFQRSWRPDPVLPVISALTLGVTSFLSYLTGGYLPLFLLLVALWTFLGGMAWSLGANAGSIGTTNAAVMLVTVTLPATVAQSLGQAALMTAGGLVQAALVVLFPIRRWGRHRDALAGALAAEADYARRLREDPTAPFTPGPFAQARDAASLSPRQLRRRPAQLHGAQPGRTHPPRPRRARRPRTHRRPPGRPRPRAGPRTARRGGRDPGHGGRGDPHRPPRRTPAPGPRRHRGPPGRPRTHRSGRTGGRPAARPAARRGRDGPHRSRRSG